MKKLLSALIVLCLSFAVFAESSVTLTGTDGRFPASVDNPSTELKWDLEKGGFEKATIGFYKGESTAADPATTVELTKNTDNGVIGTGEVYVCWDIVSSVGIDIKIYANEALTAATGNTPIDWTGTVGESGGLTFGGEGKYIAGTPGTGDDSKLASVLAENAIASTIRRSGSAKITITTEDASIAVPENYSATMTLVISQAKQ